MTIPRTERFLAHVLQPSVLLGLFVLWIAAVVVGTGIALVVAAPHVVFGSTASADGTMAPLWFDEFASADLATMPDARIAINDAITAEKAATTPIARTPVAVRENAATVYPTVLPERITVPSLGMDLPVSNPTSTNVEDLDEALNTAVVRYPGSGTVEDPTTNMLIFGHSSYLPVVYNKLYKAFNGIQHLTYGDEIHIEANGNTYVYEVFNVRKASAEEDEIPLNTGKHQLTLLTCDSFGKKSDRFIVEAEFVRSF